MEVRAFMELKRSAIESALEGELGHHLAYLKSERSTNPNSSNSFGTKTITTDHDHLTIDTPRNREAELAPQFIKKDQRQFQKL